MKHLILVLFLILTAISCNKTDEIPLLYHLQPNLLQNYLTTEELNIITKVNTLMP